MSEAAKLLTVEEKARIAEIDAARANLQKERRRIMKRGHDRLRRLDPQVRKDEARAHREWRGRNPRKVAAQNARYRAKMPDALHLGLIRDRARRKVGDIDAKLLGRFAEAKLAQLKVARVLKAARRGSDVPNGHSDTAGRE